jgi:hypothetical protein
MGNHDGSYPSLANLDKRLKTEQVHEALLQKGKGMMPSFSHISEAERKAIVDFLFNKSDNNTLVTAKNGTVPYQHTGYNRWYDKNGYPVSQPPWGTLTAVDLNTGQRRWQIPLGEYKALIDKGIPPTGTDNYGGPLVTASNLIFIAASRDEKFRAIEKETGKILWTSHITGCRICFSKYLFSEWPPICRHSMWRREAEYQVRRQVCCICVALTFLCLVPKNSYQLFIQSKLLVLRDNH